MFILHIETSTKICSVALSKDNQLVGFIDHVEGMNHTAILSPSIRTLLKTYSIKPSDLGFVSVSSGPGSYTGLRVGGATAKALAYSLNIPILGVPSLLALASAAFQKYPDSAFAWPMLDARRNEVFTSLYNSGMEQVIPVSSFILEYPAISDLIPAYGKVVCCGDGAFKLNDLAPALPNLIIDLEIQSSARHLISPAWSLISEGKKGDPLHFVPDYLKPPNITQSKKAI